jgi:hypothetical protein
MLGGLLFASSWLEHAPPSNRKDLMPSISSATQQSAFQPITPPQSKQDAAAKTNDANPADTNPTNKAVATTQQPAATTAAPKGPPESKYTRNSDGTYGPRHTLTAPFNPAKVSSSTQGGNESPGLRVDVKA